MTSPLTYRLSGYGASYLVVFASVGNGKVQSVDVFIVVTSPNEEGIGAVVNMNDISTGVTVSLSGYELTLSVPYTQYWASIAVSEL